MPFIPILIGAAVLGGGSFAAGATTGAATSEKLGTGLSLASVVIGLVLVLVLLHYLGFLTLGK